MDDRRTPGHGLLDRRGQLHLAVAGTHPDRLGFTALSYETLRAVCLDSDAASKMVILDSCFSGRAIGQALAGDDQQVLGQLCGSALALSLPKASSVLVRWLYALGAGAAGSHPVIPTD